MGIQLKKKYKCEKIIEELDELIKGAVGLYDDSPTGPNTEKMDLLETIILSHLLQKTDFKNAFDSIKVDQPTIKSFFRTTTIICDTLYRIYLKEISPTFDNFLERLNNEINSLKKKPLEKYSYYVPTRIKLNLDDKELNVLKKSIKKAIGLSICKLLPEKILKEIKSSDYKCFFQNRRIILKFEMKARDSEFPTQCLNNKIDALIGAWAFSNQPYSQEIPGSYANIAILSDPIERSFIVVKNNQISYTQGSSISYSEIRNKMSLTGEKFWHDVNYERLKGVLDNLSKQDKRIREVSEDSLKLYFWAISEKQLELSFLKFWIVTERILKQGKRTDEWIRNFLEKWIKDKHLKRMAGVLHDKRNDLTHEFRADYISEPDRELAKDIAESMILFLINLPFKIDNLQDLRILIDNINLPKQDLKKQRLIISRIINLKTKLSP